MEITFKNRKLQKIFNSDNELIRKFGRKCADIIGRRLDDISAAPNLDTLKPPFPGRCHELKHDRDGQLSIDVEQPYRLIFIPCNDDVKKKEDGGLDWKSVNAIEICGIEDTHD